MSQLGVATFPECPMSVNLEETAEHVPAVLLYALAHASRASCIEDTTPDHLVQKMCRDGLG